MKLHLTFTDGASERERRDALDCAQAHGATAVAPLFAAPALPELGRFYVVEVDAKDVARLVEALRTRHGVQAIERGPHRRALDESD